MFFKRPSKATSGDEPIYRPYKQCPDCLSKMPLAAGKCPDCGITVGEIQEDGKARKPIDWKGYIVSALLFALFYFFVRWAFFDK